MQRITTVFVGVVVAAVLAPPALAQDDPPELHPLKGAFECSVLQDAAGDVLHLNCVESKSPLVADHDIEVYRVTRRPRSDAITVWLRSKVDMAGFQLFARFRHSSDPTFVNEETVGYRLDDRRQSEEWTATVYPDLTWTSVEIVADPTYGWVCKGCGTFLYQDIRVTGLIDPTSIRPQDAARFLQEVQSIVMPRRGR